ncbi:MAG: dethiobiotin synthase [Aliiglaciecola sp.]
MSKTLFITATDTDAGKTVVASALLRIAAQQGLSTLAFKPVSAGCEKTGDGLRNQDALDLWSEVTEEMAYEEVNPIAFEDPVAPHLAAQRLSQPISVEQLNKSYQYLLNKNADLLVVEGAGGWRLPLGQGQFMSDFVKRHELPCVMVIGLKLGCLNHALLTYESMLANNINVLGWVGNVVDPDMAYLEDNIASLRKLIDAPNLGIVPHLDDTTNAASYLRLPF